MVAGNAPRALSPEVLELPERLGILQWVRFTEWLEPAELAAVYRLAQALLRPSLYESFGLPIL